MLLWCDISTCTLPCPSLPCLALFRPAPPHPALPCVICCDTLDKQAWQQFTSTLRLESWEPFELALHALSLSTEMSWHGVQRTSGDGGSGPTGSPLLPSPCAPWLSTSSPLPTGKHHTSMTQAFRSAVLFLPHSEFRQGIGGFGLG